MCLRWILEGFAQYGRAHYGHGPIEGLGDLQTPSKKAEKPAATSSARSDATTSGATETQPIVSHQGTSP